MNLFNWIISQIIKGLGGFASGEAHHPIEELKELILENAVKILLIFTAATAIGSFFVAGVSMTLMSYTSQYDKGENLRMSAVSTGGIALIVLSALIILMAIFFATKHDRERKKLEANIAKHKQINTIQDTVLLLVNDYIAEREFQREYKREAMIHSQELPKDTNPTQHKSTEEFERH